MTSLDVNMTGLQSTLLQGRENALTSRLETMQAQYLNPKTADQKKLKQAAQDFEAVFMQQMLEQMDKTVDRSDGFLSGGTAEDYWRGMMNQEVAKSMATRPGGSGMGLAETIYRQMSAQFKPEADAQSAPPPTSEVKP